MSCDSASLSLAASWLRPAREVVVFTGAGVSAESGIPTFRDDEGFWQHFPVAEFATWKGLVRTAIRRPRRLAEFIHAVLYPIADYTETIRLEPKDATAYANRAWAYRRT